MRLPRPVRRFYNAHERLTKASGIFIFLLVMVVLYVAVLRFPSGGSSAEAVTPTPTALASASPTSPPTATTAPQTPGVTATPVPPFTLGRYQVTTRTNVAYGALENLVERLDLCMPVGASGLRPGLVLLHGGSFNQGNKNDYMPFCYAFASYGFVVATPNYRLAPQNIWPAQLVDAQLVVRWMRATASENQLDPRRICAMGDTAGANLAVFLGLLTTNHPGDKTNLFSNESPHVSCVVDEFGPMNMSQLTTTPTWQDAIPLLFGEANQHNPSFLRDASPVFSVTSQGVPTLIIQGTADTFIPPNQSKQLQSQLQAANVPVTYISYAGGAYFGNITSSQYNKIQLQIVSFLLNHT